MSVINFWLTFFLPETEERVASVQPYLYFYVQGYVCLTYFLMIYPKVREAQPLIIQADVMREEMTSCCEVEYTGKSIPLLLHQVRCFCRSLSVHKGCYIGNLYNTPGKKESTDECPKFLVTPFLATSRDKNLQQKSNTVHQRHLWNYCMYTTSIQHMYCTQTKNHFVTATY